ncbi:MAG: hypothetical protein U1A78_12345 [Polyangia bacterium]
MAAPNLDLKLPLAKLRLYVRHTLLKLRIHPYPWAKTLGTQLATLLKEEIDPAFATEQKLLDAVADAEAVVDITDIELNTLARKAEVLTRNYVGPLRTEVRQTLFGQDPVSAFIKPILNDQLRAMRLWPKYLATLTLQPLKDLAPSVEAAVKAADDAIKALTGAETELAAFRSGTHAQLVKQVNLVFHDIFSEATRQAKETGVDPTEGLFLKSRRHRPLLTLARARAELAAREDEVKEARTALAELEAEAQAEQEADKKRAAQKAELVTLKQASKELVGRIKELEDELDKE